MTKKIIFTGGGSAGHVTLNLALIPIFLQQKWKVVYIGSYNGIEKELIAKKMLSLQKKLNERKSS